MKHWYRHDTHKHVDTGKNLKKLINWNVIMCRCSILTCVTRHILLEVYVLVPPTIGCALFLTVLFPENHVHATSKHVNKLKSYVKIIGSIFMKNVFDFHF